MTLASEPTDRFVYDHFELDADLAELRCHYRLGRRVFVERFGFAASGRWDDPAVAVAAQVVFLLAGVSYYKTAAPAVIDLGDIPTRPEDRTFLADYYRHGLGEFAFRNRLDLSGLSVVGPDAPGSASPVTVRLDAERPLVPFGGGIDSIVTVESVRERYPGLSLFVVSRAGDRFAAIEAAASATGLPVVRAERALDAQVLRSAELGFLNGHVPVTGILSAVAVLAAVLGGHGSVVMSNEWSASRGNLVVDGTLVNHQWSKSLDFEAGFRQLLSRSLSGGPDYFSLLRPYSELWVARRFAALDGYHRVFRSCNRAFHLDPAQRLDAWCGRCDKCCFIDLILAPFVGAERLGEIFDGAEPLREPSLADRFRTLLGTSSAPKPFECVGDVDECRLAVTLAAGRSDRQGPLDAPLRQLAAELTDPVLDRDDYGPDRPVGLDGLLSPIGPHFTPDAYAPHDQLV